MCTYQGPTKTTRTHTTKTGTKQNKPKQTKTNIKDIINIHIPRDDPRPRGVPCLNYMRAFAKGVRWKCPEPIWGCP